MDMCTPADANPGMPVSGDASVKTILYAHCPDIMVRCPINTQPLTSKEPVMGAGWATPTLGTDIPPTGPVDPNIRFINNWFSWFNSPGLVEYGENGNFREYPEQGLADQLEVVGDTTWLVVYLQFHPVPGDNPLPPDPGDASASVGLYGRIELGRNPFKGTLLAEGDTGQDRGGLRTGPDGPFVSFVGNQTYEFRVPLSVRNHTWSPLDGGRPTNGFLVTFGLYHVRGPESTDTGGWQFAHSDWRFVASPSFPPRMILEHTKPLVTKDISATLRRGNLDLRWSLMSPFGAYDVDARTIEVRVVGPAAADAELLKPPMIKIPYGGHGVPKPVSAAWTFAVQGADLPDGAYAALFSALNRQGTYRLVERVSFTIEDGRVLGLPETGRALESVPSLEGPITVLLALGVAGSVRGRGRR